MIVTWLHSIPLSWRLAMATPLANGLTVEPRQPTPAPKSTVADETMVSYPARYMTEPRRA